MLQAAQPVLPRMLQAWRSEPREHAAEILRAPRAVLCIDSAATEKPLQG